MEEYTYQTKIAIIKLLTEIMNADNVIHKNEEKFLNETVLSFKLSDDYQSEVDNMLTLQALSLIRELTIEQKREVSKMMGKMIIIDEDINYNEVIIYNDICHQCNIEEEFNVDDYPEYSLSGPFINPEDIMNLDTL